MNGSIISRLIAFQNGWNKSIAHSINQLKQAWKINKTNQKRNLVNLPTIHHKKNSLSTNKAGQMLNLPLGSKLNHSPDGPYSSRLNYEVRRNSNKRWIPKNRSKSKMLVATISKQTSWLSDKRNSKSAKRSESGKRVSSRNSRLKSGRRDSNKSNPRLAKQIKNKYSVYKSRKIN